MTTPMIDDPFGGRSVKEWIGRSPDSKVPDKVRDRVLLRGNKTCYLTGLPILPGDKWQVEHKKALALGGENRESNLAPALVEPHKLKTSFEIDLKAKADRMGRKHRGTWPKAQGNGKLRGRGFEKRRQ